MYAPQVQLHFEFHASQDKWQHLDAACIHHCLLRVFDRNGAQALAGDVTKIGNSLAQFTYLETVVLETGNRLEMDDVQSLIEALRKVITAEVQHRTCDEAHKLALQAKKSPSRPITAGLLSPFWCLQEHVEKWDKEWVGTCVFIILHAYTAGSYDTIVHLGCLRIIGKALRTRISKVGIRLCHVQLCLLTADDELSHRMGRRAVASRGFFKEIVDWREGVSCCRSARGTP